MDCADGCAIPRISWKMGHGCRGTGVGGYVALLRVRARELEPQTDVKTTLPPSPPSLPLESPSSGGDCTGGHGGRCRLFCADRRPVRL